jgi:transposase-like protein
MLEKKRRRFTSEDKAGSVKFYEESGRSLQSVAEELGVHANQLRGCRNELLKRAAAFFAREVRT